MCLSVNFCTLFLVITKSDITNMLFNDGGDDSGSHRFFETIGGGGGMNGNDNYHDDEPSSFVMSFPTSPLTPPMFLAELHVGWNFSFVNDWHQQ